MGSTSKIKDIRLTEAYTEAQADERFQSWLKYKDAAFALDEGFDRAPDLPSLPFDEEGLRAAERLALDLWSDSKEPYAKESITLSQNFVYFIGQCYVRSFQGQWVNRPPHPQIPGDKGGGSVVDLPFRTNFLNPNIQLINALDRRTGEEWAFVYRNAREDYDKWVAAGRPERELN